MITVKQMWSIIKEIGWGTKTTDYEKIQEWLVKNYTIEQIQQFEDLCRTKKSKLYECLKDKAFKSQLSIGYTGDDGFDDLCAHIVGMGKECFDKAMKERDVPTGFKYEENFFYSFHKL
jgi:predicted DNA-binding transcriptional regulator AlpA